MYRYITALHHKPKKTHSFKIEIIYEYQHLVHKTQFNI